MESDELDNLIADSLGGVQAVLDAEKRNGNAGTPSSTEAAKEPKDGPAKLSDELFADLVDTFQDENFQKAMADVLKINGLSNAAPPPSSADAPDATAVDNDEESAEFLKNFRKSFDSAVGSTPSFEQSLTTMTQSLIPVDLVCNPLKQIADHLALWLQQQEGLAAEDRARYESMMKIYRQVFDIYTSNPDPLPDDKYEEAERLLADVQALGQPPDEVMQQIVPEEAKDGETFQDFVKAMGVAGELGAGEHDLLKKLVDNPDDLTNLMKDMASGCPEESCHVQ